MRKSPLALLIVAVAFMSPTWAADSTATISNVHLCCQACVRGVEKALAGVKGVSAKVDKDAETVTLSAADKAGLQKAADALVAAGYFGKSSDSSVKLGTPAADQGKKVQKLKVEGVHLCCGQCVSTVDEAVKSVAGVKEHTAVKNAESFEVTGDFNDQEVIRALNRAGLSGKIAR
jgi:copper chaperone CopZ